MDDKADDPINPLEKKKKTKKNKSYTHKHTK